MPNLQPGRSMTHDELAPHAGERTDPGSASISTFPLQALFDAAPTGGRPTLADTEDTLRAVEAGQLATRLDFSTRYETGEVFASGGIGRIRRGFDRLLGREVAIKELRREAASPAEKARFIREAMVASHLAHPSIIPVFDVGEREDGTAYFAMKLIEGVSMDVAIEKGTPLDELLSRVIDVAEAIAYAHAKGVIHRDLKPANVLIGSFGETVVIDWGLAKLIGTSERPPAANESGSLIDVSGIETRAGAIMGTLAYMPREQAAGRVVDERADVYALGALLYHVVLRERPWAHIETGTALLEALLRDSPIPADLDARVSAPALATIIRKAMAPELADRYASAEAFAAELRRHVSGGLVEAHRYSLRDLLGLWVRRHRAGVVAGGLASVAVLGIAIGAYVELGQARDAEVLARLDAQRERDEAKSARDEAESARDEAERAGQREIRRLDQSILAQVERYAPEDPARAIAWMRLWSDDAPAWNTSAQPLAMVAAVSGISQTVWPLELDDPSLATVSADGAHLFAAGPSGVVRMALDGGHVERIGDQGDVVTLSSSADGRVAVFAGDRSLELQVWREGAGVRTIEVPRPARASGLTYGPVLSVALSADARHLAYGVLGMGVGPSYALVDLERDVVVATHDEARDTCGVSHRPRTVVISPAGWMAFAAGEPGKLRYWKLDEAHETEPATVSYAGRCADQLQLGENGEYVVASLDGGRIYTRQAGDTEPDHDDPAWASIVWSGPDTPVRRHDARLIPGPDDTVLVWQQGHGAKLLELPELEVDADAVAFQVPEDTAGVETFANGELTAVLGSDGVARISDSKTGEGRGRVTIGRRQDDRDLWPALVGADSRGRVIYLDDHDQVRLFEAPPLEPLDAGPAPGTFTIDNRRSSNGSWAVAVETTDVFAPRTLARVEFESRTRESLPSPSAGFPREPRISVDDAGQVYAIDRAARLWMWPIDGSARELADGVERFVVAADGSRVAVVDGSGGGRVLVMDGGAVEHERALYEDGEVIADLAFSPDGHRLAVAHGRGLTSIHDLRDGTVTELWSLAPNDDAYLHSNARLLWSATGDRLAMADRDGHVRVRSLSGDASEHVLEAGPCVGVNAPRLAWSSDGRWLAHGGFRLGVRFLLTLWDLESGAEYVREAPLEFDFATFDGWVASISQRVSALVLWHGPSGTQVLGPIVPRNQAASANLRVIGTTALDVVGSRGPWLRWQFPAPGSPDELRAWVHAVTNMPTPVLE
jgi:WD40 repeat protein